MKKLKKYRYNIHSLLILIVSVVFVAVLGSCESDIPNDYIPAVFVEAYIFVDEPIQGIIIQASQPVSDSFNYIGSLIRDARVRVYDSTGSYSLQFRDDSLNPGYYYPDFEYKVKPNTIYNLEIILNNGETITGKTKTSGRMNWVKSLQPYIQYPVDTLKLPPQDSLNYEWMNPGGGFNWYFVRVKCLDTLEYGKYLGGSNEKNRRTYKPFATQSRYYNDPVVWAGPLGNNKTPFIWNILKWYGLHEFAVYKPDSNFGKWFLQVQRGGTYDTRLSNLKGAMGVFGSASVLYDSTFILKNQP